MKKKSLLPFFLISFLSISLFFNSVFATVRISQPYNIFIPTNSALGFQHDSEYYVLISVLTGNITSSQSNMRLYPSSGFFRFIANDTCTLSLTWNVTNLKASGDQNNDLRILKSGAQLTVNANDNIFIQWDILGVNIWFPIEFIFGMVGLCSMFGSSIFGVHLMNKGEYVDGLKFTVVWFAFGVALTVAWLWA